MTVVGNILVVIAIFSYRPLKKVQNYFLVSLAASDLAVAIVVMPLHVVKFIASMFNSKHFYFQKKFKSYKMFKVII